MITTEAWEDQLCHWLPTGIQACPPPPPSSPEPHSIAFQEDISSTQRGDELIEGMECANGEKREMQNAAGAVDSRRDESMGEEDKAAVENMKEPQCDHESCVGGTAEETILVGEGQGKDTLREQVRARG
jgi:hypothetical protein